jgi:heme A synthase
VTWLLKPLIVTGTGRWTATFSLLLWLWLSMRARRARWRISVLAGNTVVESGRHARLWAGLGLAALALQVGLGGWTAATLACPDLQNVRRSGSPG